MRCWACADDDCDNCLGIECECECQDDDPWEDPEWDSNPWLWLDPEGVSG